MVRATHVESGEGREKESMRENGSEIEGEKERGGWVEGREGGREEQGEGVRQREEKGAT